MKSLTITFHASHNHGSMLQAFALQQILTELVGENEILNFRTERQEKMMRVVSGRKGLGPFLKDLSHIVFYSQFKKRHSYFEGFISEYLKTTQKVYRTLEELRKAELEYNLYIAGSDQIWNPRPEDFDWAYYLPFVHGRKISYAASMGPKGLLKDEEEKKIKKYLGDYFSISVREKGTKDVIEKMGINLPVSINVDPVFLLKADDWRNKLSISQTQSCKYIFFYTLFADREMIKMVKMISRKTGLPVITPYFSNVYDLFTPFKKSIASGPIEFLSMLANAELVVTSSFHGTAFSTIFHKKLISLRGLDDNRIGNLLRLAGLEKCSISSVDDIDNVLSDNVIDWAYVDHVIDIERRKSFEYLKNCIE